MLAHRPGMTVHEMVNVDVLCSNRRRHTSRRLNQPRRSTLRIADGAKDLAFELMEGLGSCEKTVAFRIA